MPVNHKIITLNPRPGIQRDGTKFDSASLINGQHVRFKDGRPRKMEGYQLLSPGTGEIIRTIFSAPKPNSFDLYIGRASGVYVMGYDNQRQSTPEVKREVPDYVADANNVWSFDLFNTTLNTGEIVSYIVAQVKPDANQIYSNANGSLYAARVDGQEAFTQLFDVDANPLTYNGGIVNISPYLFGFGKNGVVAHSDPGDLFTWKNENIYIISPYDIVAGRAARGSTSPSVLFWSTRSLIRGVYNGALDSFSFNTVGDEISILSPNSIVKVDDVYYWIGVNQFYMYTGVPQGLENTFSTDWFFDNVNTMYSHKIFGIHNKKYGEVWWFYPRGQNTECSDVIIYNYRLRCWYDTVMARSAGISANQYGYPILTDANTITNLYDPDQNLTYPIWTSEIGFNRVLFNQNLAIESYFETNIIDLFEIGAPDKQMRILRVEPDAIQVGNMEMKIIKRAFAQGPATASQAFNFSSDTPKLDTLEMSRLVSFQFISNDVDSFYQIGKVLINIAEGAERAE